MQCESDCLRERGLVCGDQRQQELAVDLLQVVNVALTEVHSVLAAYGFDLSRTDTAWVFPLHQIIVQRN